MMAPFDPLLHPSKLWSRPEVLAKPCPVPNTAGIYAWYFQQFPPACRLTTATCMTA